MPQLNEFTGLSSAVADTRLASGRLAGTTRRAIANADSLSNERSQFGSGLSLRVARSLQDAPGNSFASTLGVNTRVARVRQGIVNRGENAIRNQQLKDRIRLAQLGLRKRQRGLSSLADAANIRQGTNIANAEADAAMDLSAANLAGGLLGSLVGAFRPRGSKPGAPIGEGG